MLIYQRVKDQQLNRLPGYGHMFWLVESLCDDVWFPFVTQPAW
jgi:hypothetical protein